MLRIVPAIILFTIFTTAVIADPITTAFEGTIDGSIAGDSFTDQPFSVTVTGDTDDLIFYDFGPTAVGYDLLADSAVISLPNLNGGTTLNITSTVYMSVNNGLGLMGLLDQNFFSAIFLIDPAFSTYTFDGPIGPITSSGTSSNFPLFETDGGTFNSLTACQC